MGMTAKRQLLHTTLYILLSIGAIAMVLPFVWMLSTSFKETGEVFVFPPRWLPSTWRWQNYVEVFQDVAFGTYILNTVIVTTGIVVGQLVTCSLAAYAFARLRFPGRETLFWGYLATMMIPGQITLIPSFLIIKYLGWLDTYRALIVPGIFTAFGTFLLRQFFLTLPRDLDEAAIIDGCNPLGIYRRIILPLSRPALATLTILTFMSSWNNLLWPLVVTSSEKKRVLSIGLAIFNSSPDFGTEWPHLCAGSLLGTLPILIVYFSAQKYFVRGIALTGMKG